MAFHPFNVFQRVVRNWDQTHPYNAAQVLRLVRATAGEVERWREAWPVALKELGLGRAVVEGRRYHYEAFDPPAVEFVGPAIGFEALIEREVNAPFVDDYPFRPFIRADGDELDVGVVYQHWVADSVSMRMLLRRWLELATGLATGESKPVKVAGDGYWHHFGSGPLGWKVDEAVGDVMRSFSRFRHVRRLRGSGQHDYTKSFLVRSSPGLISGLRDCAKIKGVTIHDLFVAAAIEQCAKHLPFRQTCFRRDIALGTIVDLRPLAAGRLDNQFGLFLGFVNVIAGERDLADFDRLLGRISAQHRRAKQNHTAASGMLWLMASVIAAKFLPSEKAYHFYRKHMPLAGGISNVNLSRSWASAHHPHLIRDYVRVSPTGPMIPVAFTPTSLGDDLNLAMTYRSAIIPRETAEAMAEGFLSRLTHLTAKPQAG